MGKFANVGEPEVVLMEEMAEAIQVISKKLRFGGWDEIPPGKTETRWEMLKSEMADVMHHFERLTSHVVEQRQKKSIHREFTLNGDMAQEFNDSQDYDDGSWD